MTRAGRLRSSAGAITPLVVILGAACAGGPGVDPAATSAAPTGAPDPATTTTPPDSPPPTEPTCGGWNGLDFFASASAELVQECLLAGANPHNPAELTPVIFRAAAAATDPRVIHLLVDAGADLHAALGRGLWRTGYRDGYTPLHTAAALNPTPGIIDALVSAGFDLDARDRDGATPLHVAWTNPNPAVFRALLRSGSDPLARDERGRPADPTSCMNWTTGAFARLALPDDFRRCLALEDIQAYSGDGDTPLHLAVEVANAAAVRILLEAGADLTARNNAGATPLHVAATNEGGEILTLLMESGADINVGADSHGSPLLSAIMNRRGFNRRPMNEVAVNALLEAGADVNAADSAGNTPLLASMDPDRRVGLLGDLPLRLLALGADPNWRDGQGRTPLYAAAAAEGPEVIQALLEAGADPQALTDDGASPLHAAAATGSPEVITLLASIGLDPDARNGDAIAPLHLAVERNNTNRGQSIVSETEGERPPWMLAKGEQPPWVLRALALLEAGADPNARTAAGDTPLHLSVWHGDSTLVSAFVQAGADVHTRNDRGETPLHAARAWDSRPAVRALLDFGADPDARDNAGLAADPVCWGAGPVHPWEFLARSPVESVRGCLQTGIPVDARDAEGATFLARIVSTRGCCTDFENVLAAFVEAGADVNARDSAGRTVLHRAQGGIGIPSSVVASVTAALLDSGADPNARDSLGSTPLHVAVAAWGEPGPSVSLLATASADLNARNSAGETPLHVALRGRLLGDDAEIVQTLLRLGADPTARDGEGNAADPVACERWGTQSFFALADADIVAGCIAGGANVQLAVGRSPLAVPPVHAAARTRDPAVISILLETGADVHERDEFYRYTPLHVAAQSGTAAVVRALLEAGAQADAWATGFATDWGWSWTPLHLAARSNPDPEVIRALVEAGADLHAGSGESYLRGNTPLHYAGENPNPDVAAALLDAGADVNALSGAGRTPLHEAAAKASSPAVIELLVAAGADVNARDRSGYTPLHSAAWYNPRAEIASALIAAGADVHARHPDGYVPSGRQADDRTPLFMAVYRGGGFIGGQPMPTMFSGRVVKALVRAGADLEHPNSSGRTPLHAAALSNPAVFPLLLRLGADPNARDADGRTPLDYGVENRSLEGLPEVLRMRQAMRGR